MVASIVFFGVLGWIVVNAPGWAQFQAAFLDADLFWASLPRLVRAFWTNVQLFLLAEVLILAFGLLLAVMRSLTGPVLFPIRALATIYVDIFRAVPGVLVIFMLGFGMPALGIAGMPVDQFFWAIVTLTLVYSAYVSEVYRAGIESVHPSQEAAARSLGLSRAQALRFVILPQAVRRVVPPAPQRLHRPPEGHGAGLVHRRRRDLPDCADHQRRDVQLHALRRRGARLHRGDDPARPVHRLAGREGPPPRRGRSQVSGTGEAAGAPSPPGPALVIEGLHKSFGKNEVLRGIDLTVAEHEVICLIGASGSGKSTLLRCINLIEPIDTGRIVVEGEEITARNVDVNRIRRRIGIVFQAFNLFPHMSVLDNVTLAPRKALKMKPAEAEERGRALLRRFGLDEKALEFPDRLSGGQQQRVAIVRALAMEPDLLLLDEVTSALDPELVAEVLNVVRELAAGGMTMLIATHEMGFARDIANRVCFLDAGRILEEGPPDRIFSAPREERTQQFLRRIVEAGRL